MLNKKNQWGQLSLSAPYGSTHAHPYQSTSHIVAIVIGYLSSPSLLSSLPPTQSRQLIMYQPLPPSIVHYCYRDHHYCYYLALPPPLVVYNCNRHCCYYYQHHLIIVLATTIFGLMITLPPSPLILSPSQMAFPPSLTIQYYHHYHYRHH